MKKLVKPITLFSLGIILFSSCSNSSKLAFTKRHYRNGYFVNHAGKVHTYLNPSVAEMSLKPERKITSSVVVKAENPSMDNTFLVASQKLQVTENVTTPKKAQAPIPFVNYKNSNCVTPVIQTTKANAADVTSSSSQGHHDSDNISVPYIVIVLCAIFIPPLGVGLMYGLNSYFWIDLILTLIFFFPGMLFALIVVLM